MSSSGSDFMHSVVYHHLDNNHRLRVRKFGIWKINYLTFVCPRPYIGLLVEINVIHFSVAFLASLNLF